MIMTAALASDALILVGETGSGKTTQVPQFLLEAGVGDGPGPKQSDGPGPGAARRRPLQIGVTQPRRVAAIAVARRVADEMGTDLGGPRGTVGYAVRFDEASGPAVRVKFVTDGMLLR